MKYLRHSPLLLALAALGVGLSTPAAAQADQDAEKELSKILEEVVVTARRREENLQEVAVSMTVFNQEKLDDANILNAGDIATYTPSLQTNNRFGGDNTTFAIRGFSQELRTTASVGVYFAEVVASRGANTQQSGDGAGPGDFFDLANVQVLKGPTGTLFGRNTTGGAVLLTPQKPTDEFEGYVEGSKGNYDMWRGQAVVNIPISDTVKLRLGVDRQERDGYLSNISDVGPEDFANVDYTAYRVSVLWDITEDLENYTILRSMESENNGYPSSLLGCNPVPTAPLGIIFCLPDLQQRQAAGDDGFYDVYNFIPDPVNDQEMSQIINTTTWQFSEDLTFKNILAYSTFETRQRSSIYGSNWRAGPAFLIFQMVGLEEGANTSDQNTFVEEFQVQGTSFDKRLTWQAGLYYEKSEPDDDYGAQSAALISCDFESIKSSNPSDFRCNDLLRQGSLDPLDAVGAVQAALGGVEYTNKAIYAEATYDITEMWSVTAGLRYTHDKAEGKVTEGVYKFYTNLPGSYLPPVPTESSVEVRKPKTESEEPTWLLGVDYKPMDDMLVYAKYTRGYRQGNVNLGGETGLDTHDPEKVDTYEIGFKNSWRKGIPATLNMAAFYNEFDEQQIQYGYFKSTGIGTTAIVNAGSSIISGFELEGNVQPHEQIIIGVSYSYLDTEVKDLNFPATVSSLVPSTTTAPGEPLSYAPRHNYVVTATWLMPVNPEIGDMSFSTTYVFTDERQAVSKYSSALSKLEDYELVNFNFNWKQMFGGPMDFSAFVTNYTDEEYVTFLTGNWNNGFEFGQLGQPKMYGARIRYNF